jgi:hypothetical protein
MLSGLLIQGIAGWYLLTRNTMALFVVDLKWVGVMGLAVVVFGYLAFSQAHDARALSLLAGTYSLLGLSYIIVGMVFGPRMVPYLACVLALPLFAWFALVSSQGRGRARREQCEERK